MTVFIVSDTSTFILTQYGVELDAHAASTSPVVSSTVSQAIVQVVPFHLFQNLVVLSFVEYPIL